MFARSLMTASSAPLRSFTMVAMVPLISVSHLVLGCVVPQSFLMAQEQALVATLLV